MNRLIFICLVLFFQSTSSYCQSNKTIRFGNNSKIEIPSNLVTTDLGPQSNNITIVKTNTPVDGCYYYFKLSYFALGQTFSKQEFQQEKQGMLDKIQTDYKNDKANMERVYGAKILSENKPQIIEIDKAVGTFKSYTYTSDNTGTRKAIAYQLYYKDKLYYLTFGWGIKGDEKLAKLSRGIINSIVF